MCMHERPIHSRNVDWTTLYNENDDFWDVGRNMNSKKNISNKPISTHRFKRSSKVSSNWKRAFNVAQSSNACKWKISWILGNENGFVPQSRWYDQDADTPKYNYIDRFVNTGEFCTGQRGIQHNTCGGVWNNFAYTRVWHTISITNAQQRKRTVACITPSQANTYRCK